MTLMALGDIAFHKMGGTPSTAEDGYWEAGDLLWATPGDLGKGEVRRVYSTARKITAAGLAARNTALFPAGTVLLSTTATIGNIGLATCPIYCNQQITAIVPNENVLPEYLAYWLLRSRDNLMRLGGTSTATHINQKNLATLEVPVRPLPEQRRIVDLLSRAEDIVRLRREAENKAAELIPALFLDMFGDPATNPKEWARAGLGSLLDSIDSGHSPKCHGEQKQADEWGVLKLSALSGGIYREGEHKTLPSEIVPDTSVEIRAGDVLLSRKNTHELVGTAAYVEKTGGRMLLPDLIFRLGIADQKRLDPVYLWGLLSSNSKREQIRKLASGSAGSMPNISKARLKTLEIEMPPHMEQVRFSTTVEQMRSIQAQQSAATAKAQATFDALLARAYSNDERR